MTDEQQPPPERGAHTHGTGGPPPEAAAGVGGGGETPAEEAARRLYGELGDVGPGAGPGAGTGSDGGEGTRRIRRSRKHKVAGGVCAGLGRYFDVDPVVFRVPLAVLSVIGGLGLIFYGCAWLLIPALGEKENELRKLLSGRLEGGSLAAFLCALAGCGLFLASLGNDITPFSVMLVAAVAGAAYWSRHRRQSEAAEADGGAPVDPATAHAVAEAPPEAQAPPMSEVPQWWQDPLKKSGWYVTYEGTHGAEVGAGTGTGYLWGPEKLAKDGSTWAGPGPGGGAGMRPTGWRPPERTRQRSIGGLVFVAAVAAAGIGTAALWDIRPLGTSLTVGLACALAVFGVGLVVSSFAGRLGGGTVVAVILTALLLAGAAALPKDIGTHWDNRRWEPTTAEALQPTYRMDGGRGELDLRRLDLKRGQTVRTEARTGAGQLTVLVPEDVTVRLDGHVDAGEIRVPRGATTEGRPLHESSGGLDRSLTTTLKPLDSSTKPKGTIALKLRVGVGQGEVVRETPDGRSDQKAPGTARSMAAAPRATANDPSQDPLGEARGGGAEAHPAEPVTFREEALR
ncbi:PspC domain-containing protein [Streptomyces sp. ODS28]|uniref:PspC domain-containing protein n=1 Tax=Streptomyces sp. ODS28 TaxID=3136688 RepID=UPI0031EFC290